MKTMQNAIVLAAGIPLLLGGLIAVGLLIAGATTVVFLRRLHIVTPRLDV